MLIRYWETYTDVLLRTHYVSNTSFLDFNIDKEYIFDSTVDGKFYISVSAFTTPSVDRCRRQFLGYGLEHVINTRGKMEATQNDMMKDGSGYRLHRLNVYETASRYYLVGGDIQERRFRILKIDRTADAEELCIAQDETVYSKQETNHVLNTVDHGNKASGGLKLRCSAWGLLGFIRFTGAFYMLLITKRSQVAVIGGHYIYQIDATDLISLGAPSLTRLGLDQDEESRFVSILHNLDLNRSFYFSYTYDITHSLQHNIMIERENMHAKHRSRKQYNTMFVWNSFLLQSSLSVFQDPFDWCLPIVHGFINQAGTFWVCKVLSKLNPAKCCRYLDEAFISPLLREGPVFLLVRGS